MSDTCCDPQKLTRELQEANLPVAGVCSDGRVDYARALTAAEKKIANEIIAAHDPAPEAEGLRMSAYRAAGISAEDMLMALWERTAQGDSARFDALKLKMDALDRLVN